MWQTHPTWTDGLTADEFRESYRLGYYRVLRELDADGNVVTVMHPAQLDFGEGFNPMPWFRSSMMLAMYAADNPLWQLKGCTVFITYRGMTLSQAWQMIGRIREPETSHNMKQVYKDSMPNRLRRIVIADTPFYFNTIWAIGSLLLPAKIRERVAFCGSSADALASVIPASTMPADIGGENDEPFEWWLDDVLAAEAAGWSPATGWPGGAPPEGWTHGHRPREPAAAAAVKAAAVARTKGK